MQEQFKYLRSPYTTGLSAFSAKMTRFSYDKHAHEEYSIGVSCSGRQDFFSNGAYYKSNTESIMFFNPEQVHDGCAGAGSPMEYAMLYIPEPILMNLMRSLSKVTKDQARLNTPIFKDTMLRKQVFSLFRVMQQPNAFSVLEEEQMLLGITQSIARLGGGEAFDKLKPQSRKDTLLIRAKEFIHYNLHRKISVDDIACAANISKFHFIRLFCAQFGMTPHQYVLYLRINQSKLVLESGERAVNVAAQFGFSDINHLNRKFKNVFGITPTEYQRQLFGNLR